MEEEEEQQQQQEQEQEQEQERELENEEEASETELERWPEDFMFHTATARTTRRCRRKPGPGQLLSTEHLCCARCPTPFQSR